MLAQGQDSAILRFGLGSAYFKEGAWDPALRHLQEAVKQNPDYSAAWKLLGRACMELDKDAEAREAFANGIAQAEHHGDIQAAREMRVFLKRLDERATAKA